MTPNDDFKELALSLQTYLEKERATARGSSIDHNVAKSLREKVNQNSEKLVNNFLSEGN